MNIQESIRTAISDAEQAVGQKLLVSRVSLSIAAGVVDGVELELAPEPAPSRGLERYRELRAQLEELKLDRERALAGA